MPAALLVSVFISLHLFFTCLCSSELDLGHILTALSDIVEKFTHFIERPVWYESISESVFGFSRAVRFAIE